MRVASILAICLLVTACSDDESSQADLEDIRQPADLVGDDRDQFGCIGSAGYRWCGMKLACVRPGELAEQEGFENTEEAYLMFCENKTLKQ